ncbi:MAG: CoA-binding protein [Promethearchaeota archaeon]
MRVNSLEFMFRPESVALLGASGTPGKSGFNVLYNLNQTTYKRGIYPINPKHEDVLGIRSYKSILDLPDIAYPLDLVVVCIPPKHVKSALDDCFKIHENVRTIIIESGQFAGTPGESRVVALEMREILKGLTTPPRILGPNSIGIIDFKSRVNTSLIPFNGLPTQDLPGIAIAGQTGLIASGYLQRILSENIFPVSKVCCLGNKFDVNEVDVLQFLGEDPETNVILLYMEGTSDGRAFIDQARKTIHEVKKPIFIVKSGKSKAGASMVGSHTGSIAGNDCIFNAAIKSAGIRRVQNFEELWDIATFIHRAGIPRGMKLGVISISGAGCTMSLDAAELHDIVIPPLSGEAKSRFSKIFPEWFEFTNPVDLWAAIERIGSPKAHSTAFEIMVDDGIDGLMLVTLAMPESLLDWENILKIKKKHQEITFILVLLGGHDHLVKAWKTTCQEHGIPVYTSPDLAIRDFSRAFLSQNKKTHSKP